MRAILLVFLIACAVISGWTSALARTQALGGPVFMMPQHNAEMHRHVGDISAAGTSETDCVGQHADCSHRAKPVHPLLCAACFAIEATTLPMPARAFSEAHLVCAIPRPLHATDQKPRFPPPKV